MIRTIDLWTERFPNDYECFNGAFVDGFESGDLPFDEYKIIRNCNCIIDCSREDVNISNKHNAIIFYNRRKPVRLMVINGTTDVDRCIELTLKQYLKDKILGEVFAKNEIKSTSVDLQEAPIFNNADSSKEIDVGSCDRWVLLYNMLKGNYTEDDTPYGNYQSCIYEFVPELKIDYSLKTDAEEFLIEHRCAFINDIKTRIVPVQENSPLSNNRSF